MKIERIETVVVTLPERREHPTMTGAAHQGNYVITKIYADGLVGLGEATVLKEWGGDHGRYYGETPGNTVKLINEVFGPAIIGANPMQIEVILDKLDRAAKGYPYAKASIDIALHDLKGKALEVPVYELLGGLYRSEVSIAHSLGILEMQRLLDEVATAVEEGVKTIKLKVGADPERDVETVKRVRELVGDEIDITVDANQGWPTPKTAIRTIRQMEPYRILFAEQPVEGLYGLTEVARAVDTPIMADESAWTPQDVLEIARREAADVISVYTTKPGGLTRAKKVAAVAEAAGFPCNVNGSAETGVGTAANIHLAASTKIITQGCVFPVSAPAEHLPTQVAGRFYRDDIITEALEYHCGAVAVPSGPGLGIELDEAKIAKYRQIESVVK